MHEHENDVNQRIGVDTELIRSHLKSISKSTRCLSWTLRQFWSWNGIQKTRGIDSVCPSTRKPWNWLAIKEEP